LKTYGEIATFSVVLTLNYGIENSDAGAEACLGSTTETIEKGRLVKEGNAKVATGGQTVAMYGRIKMDATEKIFDLLELRSTDVFIDIGHGIGNAVLQAAFTRGCESRGIELQHFRNLVATQFDEVLQQEKVREKEKSINNTDVSKANIYPSNLLLFSRFLNIYTTSNVSSFLVPSSW